MRTRGPFLPQCQCLETAVRRAAPETYEILPPPHRARRLSLGWCFNPFICPDRPGAWRFLYRDAPESAAFRRDTRRFAAAVRVGSAVACAVLTLGQIGYKRRVRVFFCFQRPGSASALVTST